MYLYIAMATGTHVLGSGGGLMVKHLIVDQEVVGPNPTTAKIYL